MGHDVRENGNPMQWRGDKRNIRGWTAGINWAGEDEVLRAENMRVENGTLYQHCGVDRTDAFGMAYWQEEDGMFTEMDYTVATEETYVPHDPYKVVFDWDTCENPLTVPDINCNSPEWHVEEYGRAFDRYNVVTGELLVNTYLGSC